MSYLVQPITGLTEATKRLVQGHFNLQLPTNRRDEIGQLASHFNQMALQLENADKAKKEFVANVSHEIQSPLASIQGFADSLLRLLMQIWSNLLTNAVSHIPSGRSIDIGAYKEQDCCVIEKSDSGDGIAEESLPYIFNRFYRGDTARQRGNGSTGLGLSIVQKIVHLHEGTIEVTSKVGEGVLFRTRIPN